MGINPSQSHYMHTEHREQQAGIYDSTEIVSTTTATQRAKTSHVLDRTAKAFANSVLLFLLLILLTSSRTYFIYGQNLSSHISGKYFLRFVCNSTLCNSMLLIHELALFAANIFFVLLKYKTTEGSLNKLQIMEMRFLCSAL
jgi:hypothetical protein